MNLYPGGREDRKGDTAFDLCLERGIVGIGWSEVNRRYKTGSAKKYAESAEGIIPVAYRPKGRTELEKWRRQFSILSRLAKGDLVWTKRSRGNYYLNRILDTEITPVYGEDYSQSDFGSARKCEWNEVRDDLEVPAEVKRNIRGTIHSIKDPKGSALAISELLYNEFKGDEVFHVPPFKGELFDFLAPQDVEDLVGLFLQAKKNLLVIPSTSKQSASPVEFLMIDRKTGEEAGVQVKTGNQAINFRDYVVSPRKNYFFQEKRRSGVTPDKNIEFIERKELFDFAKNNPTMLPRSIRRLVERLEVTERE